MQEQVFEITSCEVCGSNELAPVLNLGNHPMCDDLVPVNNKRVCKEYPIEILFCNTCLTAHQKYQVPKHDLFPKTYHYRSRFTTDVLNGMKSLVARTEEISGGIKGKKVLDIGCNDGSLLDFFKEKGAETFGIEPTDAALDARDKGHIVYSDFLSLELAKELVLKYGHFDLITFTNVFAHIEDLSAVIAALKHLADSTTVFIIENHYLGAVLDGNQFDTFYHEHPRTYSFSSFKHIASSLGYDVINVEFPSRYGGNIRVFFGKHENSLMNHEVLKDIELKESRFFDKFRILNERINTWKVNKRQIIEDYVAKNGPIRAKAFPGRAAILVKLLNLNHGQVSMAYEKPGSMKIGHFIPGTNIPIGSDDSLFAETDKSQPILNFAWHISKEIKNYLRSNNYTGDVIDILTEDDFKQS